MIIFNLNGKFLYIFGMPKKRINPWIHSNKEVVKHCQYHFPEFRMKEFDFNKVE